MKILDYDEDTLIQDNYQAKNVRTVNLAWAQNYIRLINHWLFSGNTFAFSALSKLLPQKVQEHSLYGLVFASKTKWRLDQIPLWSEFLLQFLSCDYPHIRIGLSHLKMDKLLHLLHLAIDHPQVQPWLKIQGIKLLTLEYIMNDYNAKYKIPMSNKIRLYLNEQLLKERAFSRLLTCTDSVAFYLLCFKYDYINFPLCQREFIRAYEINPCPALVSRYLHQICRELRYDVWFLDRPYWKLLSVIAETLVNHHCVDMDRWLYRLLSGKIIGVELRNVIIYHIDWLSQWRPYSRDILIQAKSPQVYLTEDLTEEILYDYLCQGYPGCNPENLTSNKVVISNYQQLVKNSPRIQQLLLFSPLNYHWVPYDMKKRIISLFTLQQVAIHTIGLLPVELMFIIIQYMS